MVATGPARGVADMFLIAVSYSFIAIVKSYTTKVIHHIGLSSASFSVVVVFALSVENILNV